MESSEEIINRLQEIYHKIFDSYKEKAKHLNDSFLQWLADKYKEANYCNYTPAFRDYQKYMNKIIEEKKKEENDAALLFQAQYPQIFKSFQFNKIDLEILGISPTLNNPPDEAEPTSKVLKLSGSIENFNNQSTSNTTSTKTAEEANNVNQLRGQPPVTELNNKEITSTFKNVTPDEQTSREALNSTPKFKLPSVPSSQHFKIGNRNNNNVDCSENALKVVTTPENSQSWQNGYMDNSVLLFRKQPTFNNIKNGNSVNQAFKSNSVPTFGNFSLNKINKNDENDMNGKSAAFHDTQSSTNPPYFTDGHKFFNKDKMNNSVNQNDSSLSWMGGNAQDTKEAMITANTPEKANRPMQCHMKLSNDNDKKSEEQSPTYTSDVSKIPCEQLKEDQDSLPTSSVTSSTADEPISENSVTGGQREITEDGAVYSVRCKVFIKKMKMYADHGIAFLFIKQVESKDKCQVVVRSDSATANILVNVLLTNQTPIRKMGKNNVMIICHATPESKSLETIIIKVKTTQDADQLIQNIENFTLQNENK